MLKKFLITHRLQTFQMPLRIQLARLFNQSVFDHFIDPSVDAFVQYFAVGGQSDVQAGKGARRDFARTKSGKRLARRSYHRQSPQHPVRIFLVNRTVVLKVFFLQFIHQFLQPVGFQFRFQLRVDFIRYFRKIIQTLTDRPQVQTRAAD